MGIKRSKQTCDKAQLNNKHIQKAFVEQKSYQICMPMWMHEHVSTWSWYWNKDNTKQTLILTCEDKHLIKSCETKALKVQKYGKEPK